MGGGGLVGSGTEINISGNSNELREFLTDSYGNTFKGGSNSFGSKSKNSSLLKRSSSSGGQIAPEREVKFKIKSNNFIGPAIGQGIAVSEASD
jgi:hypothetical protein